MSECYVCEKPGNFGPTCMCYECEKEWADRTLDEYRQLSMLAVTEGHVVLQQDAERLLSAINRNFKHYQRYPRSGPNPWALTR